MLRETDRYYFNQDEPVRSCLLTLREMILCQDENITETLKWSIPCFCYRKKMFCFLSTDKKTQEPYILIVEGNQLSHPLLEIGKRTRMKILRVNSKQDIPVEVIKEILQAALDLYRKGIIPIR